MFQLDKVGARKEPHAIPNVKLKELIKAINSIVLLSLPLWGPKNIKPPVQKPFVIENKSMLA